MLWRTTTPITRLSLASDNGPLAIMWSIELNEIDPKSRINRNEVRARMQAK